jgi:hypothetical protein
VRWGAAHLYRRAADAGLLPVPVEASLEAAESGLLLPSLLSVLAMMAVVGSGAGGSRSWPRSARLMASCIAPLSCWPASVSLSEVTPRK